MRGKKRAEEHCSRFYWPIFNCEFSHLCWFTSRNVFILPSTVNNNLAKYRIRWSQTFTSKLCTAIRCLHALTFTEENFARQPGF